MSSDPTFADAGAHDDAIIVADALSKSYTLYDRPSDRLRHLLMPWRKYPRFDALKGVSFKVNRGETVGIIGRNGAGKSTLLQLVTGTIPPTSGGIAVAGRIAALLELGAGFEPDFTGRENVMLNGTILGLDARQLRERMDSIVAFSELEEFIDRPVRTYSSGMFMRLAFSVAAHVDADILIIDEALAVGDARFTQKCMRYLNDFKRRGSILFVSHDLGAVTGLCDRAIWLDHGAVRAEGSAIAVCEQYVASQFEGPADDADSQHAETESAAPIVKAVAGETIVMFERDPAVRADDGGVASCSAFNPNASSFGIGGARITDAGLVRPGEDRRLETVNEGQDVELRVVVDADEVVERPIVGFYIKDRLGQLLFGDNTFREKAPVVPVAAGSKLVARFRFPWPALARGSYTLTVAIADGTMANHVQRHWMHDAVVFEVLASSAHLTMVGLHIGRATFEVIGPGVS
ncbi:MAG: ABC transporter ATP-binding protein [Rhodobacteraceae bacterium]|nr:ABC transporter ATP-binding protein [Paracoccaceae bacterium]